MAERGLTYKDWIFRGIGLCLTIFVLWNTFNPLDPIVERSIFVGFLVVMVFMKDWVKPTRSRLGQTVDLILILASAVVFGYVIVMANQLPDMVLSVPPLARVLGIISILVVLEATRRGMGWSLTILVGLFAVYIFYGDNLPAWAAGHVPFSLDRIIVNIYLSTNGLFGSVASVMLKYVVLFVLFGILLEWTHALNFIMKVALALVGRFRGGPAMVAVVSSGLMGAVSGSAVANVMVAGTITIPIMKRTGFKPWVAGGIEAAASSGGQFMPPVMGATAFLIAQNLGIAYLKVIEAALIPAVLYYIGILVTVYVYARRSNTQTLSRDEIPTWREVFSGAEAFTFLGGFAVLVTLLVMDYSAQLSVTYAMLTILVIDIVHKLIKRQRFDVKDFVRVAAEAPRGFADLGVASASVGIIVAVILLTGLAGRVATLIVSAAGGSLVMALILTMVGAIIMGAGLPTSIIYILLALVLGPTLQEMGINPLAGHLFIFFGGLMSMVTPPVAMAAFAAATIAKTDFWRTGVQAFIFSLPAYILPFSFVFDNSLLMMGSAVHIAFSSVTALAGVSLLGSALVVRPKDKLEYLERALMAGAAVLLILPSQATLFVALVMVVVALFRPVRRYLSNRREKKLTHAS